MSQVQLSLRDLACQQKNQLLHSSFFADLGLADGEATIFFILCRDDHSAASIPPPKKSSTALHRQGSDGEQGEDNQEEAG